MVTPQTISVRRYDRSALATSGARMEKPPSLVTPPCDVGICAIESSPM